jgi:hypothetical protein
LIDHEHDEAPAAGDIRAEHGRSRGRRRGLLVADLGHVFRGRDLARPAVDRESEVGGRQRLNGLAVASDHRDVRGHEVDGRAERLRWWCVLRASLGLARDDDRRDERRRQEHDGARGPRCTR